MEDFILNLDYYGVLNLHKALLEAKFNVNPDNEMVSGSPLVADIYKQVREWLIKNDESGQWKVWFQLKNRPDYKEHALIRMRKNKQWEKAHYEKKKEIAKNYLAPFIYDEQELNDVITELERRNKEDYMEMIRRLYGVEELQGYTEEEIAVVKKYFDPLPLVLEEFWKMAARTEEIHKVQDQWTKPEDFDKWGWLRDSDYLVILIENQGCCRAGIRRKDLGKADPPVYVAADGIDGHKWILCTRTLGEFLQAALAYEAVFAFPYHGEELMYWLTQEELKIVRSGLERQPFDLHGWLGMDMSFYSNASDNMAVIMDCGGLEALYGAASETGYKKLMEVMEGLGEAM